jgi:hypothetical protein
MMPHHTHRWRKCKWKMAGEDVAAVTMFAMHPKARFDQNPVA